MVKSLDVDPIFVPQEKIMSMHCGVYQTSYEVTSKLMPEVKHIIDFAVPYLQYDIDKYIIDVKVHMLMPKQYPCIPNWHFDFIPRGKKGQKLKNKIKPTEMMYLYISGDPLPEWEGFNQQKGRWASFTQTDIHRGTISYDHQWRLFIRLVPRTIYNPGILGGLRRHTQVYLDANSFEW